MIVIQYKEIDLDVSRDDLFGTDDGWEDLLICESYVDATTKLLDYLNDIEATQLYYRAIERFTVDEIVERIKVCKAHEIGLQKCNCGKEIEANPRKIEMYFHDGGIYIEGKDNRQWVYYHCSKCNYDWALWKLRMGFDAAREQIPRK